jgi:microcin C transport system substrate-binding protein
MNTLRSLIAVIIIGTLTACGDTPEEDASDVYDNTAEVEAFYRDNPERFVFASPDALPDDLDWQDGSDLPTFGDPRAKRGGRLTLRLNNMQQTLRVLGPDANSTLRGPLWSANTVYLIHRHPWADGYIPGVAKQWAIDPNDSTTVYLRLDPDARWSDGKSFTVDDVFFSLFLLLSPHLNDPAINRVYDENLTRLTRYDDLTFAVTQSKPSPEPLYGLATLILAQRDFYREFGPDYTDRYHWRFAPVTGPYVLDESTVKRGRQITFERLDDWWANDKPFYRHRFNPNKITYVVVRDDNKAFETFLNGDIDWHSLNLTSLWYERADAEPIRDGYVERAWAYDQLPAAREGVYINAMHPLLTDKTLRVGIQHAINYEKVNAGLYRGDRRRIRSFADGYGEYSHPALKAREYDLAKAEEHFTKAGFTQRGDDGILVDENGNRLSFVMTVANRGDEPQVATVLKEEAEKAGLEFVIEALDPTAYFTKTFEKNHQIAIHGWNTGYSPLPAFEWELRGADAGKPSNFNTTNIKDEELDALLAEWDSLADPVRSKQVSHGIQERIHDFAAWVPGLTRDYTRIGYWRWVRWPEYFQVPRYFFFTASGVFWIDEEMRQETLAARKEGSTFPAKTEIYERWR